MLERAGSTSAPAGSGTTSAHLSVRSGMATTKPDREVKVTGKPGPKSKGKLNPNKSPPVPHHLKAAIGEIEECETPVLPEHYVVVDDLRYVLPYHFDFRLHAKKRMVGVPIVDLFASEFPVRPRSYYEAAYAEGRLRVEGELDVSGGLRPGQCCRHFVHRHEPPVPAAPVEVLAQSGGIVAVNKPACMPVHVTGQYRKNTVVALLAALRPDLGKLAPAHRLDKPVSGVLLLTKDAAAAEQVRAAITEHRITKEYVARVQGAFPYSRVTVKNPLLWDHKANKGTAVRSFDEPAAPPANPDGAAVTVEFTGTMPPDAKTAETDFELVRIDEASGTSLVRCTPKTGRSHQLRIHLALLGHPIANDQLYGGQLGLARPAFMLRRPGNNAEERRAVAARREQAAAQAAAAPEGGGAAAAGAAASEAAAGIGHSADGRGLAAQGADEDGAAKRVRSAAGGLQDAGAAADATPAAVQGCEQTAAGKGGGDVASPARKIARSSALAEGAPTASVDPDSGSVHTSGLGAQAGPSQVSTAAAAADGGAAPPAVDAGSAEAEAVWGTRRDAASAPELVPEARRDPLCPHCPQMSPRDYPLDLQPLWLHAEKYSSDAWAFCAPLPDWAAVEYVVPGAAGTPPE